MYRNQHQIYTIDIIRKIFEDRQCKLVSTEYKNAKTKLDYFCPKGHNCKIIFDSFRRGNGCRKCGVEKVSGKQQLTAQEIRDTLKDKNITIITDLDNMTVSAKIRICVKCNECGIILERCWAALKKYKKCFHTPSGRPRKEDCYQWRQDRETVEKEFCFRQKCYKLLKNALKSLNKVKKTKTHILLGYTYKDLANHIENHPNWELVKNDKWHIDHIFPIQAFVEWGISDISVINCLENLRPLEAKENLIKSDKYNLDEFKTWLLTKGITI